MFGAKGTGTEVGQSLTVEERFEIFHLEGLYLLYLVRGTETVEYVHERNTRLERHEVRYGRKVHNLLHTARRQHGETGLTGSHYILMVAEDRERLCRQSTRRHVEYAGKKLARDLIHVGNHQKQTLRCGERRGECAALQRTVHSTRRTGFGLHLYDLYGLSEDVLTAGCRPFVNQFCHGRRRCDGVNRRHFAEHVSDVRCGVVTVTGDEFLLLSHSYKR